MLHFSCLKCAVCTLSLKRSPVCIECRRAKWMAGLLASATVEALNWNVLYLSVWQTVFQAEKGYSDRYTKKQRSQCCTRQVEQWAPAAAEGKECIANQWQSSLQSVMCHLQQRILFILSDEAYCVISCFLEGDSYTVWVGGIRISGKSYKLCAYSSAGS